MDRWPRSAATGNLAASRRGDDCHGIRVAERVATTLLGHGPLEHRKDKPCASREARRDGREAVRTGIFRVVGLGPERPSVGAIHPNRRRPPEVLPVETREHAVGGRVCGDLQEKGEAFTLVLVRRVALDTATLFDHRDERVIVARIDLRSTSKRDRPKATLDPNPPEPDRTSDLWCMT